MKDTCSETVLLRNLRNRFTNCGWCHSRTRQSFGSTPELCSSSNQSTFLTGHCPPEINCFENDYINVENSTLITLNGFFSEAGNQRINICGSPCSLLSSTESRLLCRTERLVYNGNNLKSGHCPITLEALFLNETYSTSPRCAKKLLFAEQVSTNDHLHRLLFVAIFMSILVLTPAVSFIHGLCRNLAINKKNSDADCGMFSRGSSIYSTPSDSSDGLGSEKEVNYDLCYLVPNSIKIDSTAVDKKNIIGMGHFGVVYKGEYRKPDGSVVTVAIKTLKIGMGNVQQCIDEGVRMKLFDHKNVLSLIGLTFDEFNQPLIITPFMTHGDLLSYLRCAENCVTVGRLLTFGLEIAEGLEYLHHLRYVHRDLAARNCMLDDELCVKVADFGLSRDVYETEYYKSSDPEADMPVKWLPVESIERGEYSSKSDVWSFGVTLWELMTRGRIPYSHLRGYRLLEYIKSGRRLPKPEMCYENIYELMKMCWQEKPADRPDGTCVVVRLKAIITMLATHAPSYNNMKTTVEFSSELHKELSSIETLHIEDCGFNEF
uniref:receptor protein-tyrosine kinase n=1 Tax=Romanomermis culicivorax TaxID=13658 RepID=A0A915KU05_ROMCU